MMSVVVLNASNLDIRRGILHTRIFWQLTHQSLPMRLTPWRQTAGSALRSPSLGNSTIQSITMWASYITALPVDHHVPRDVFRTAFYTHHLYAVLLYIKLKEFLDLEHGNHSVFDYMR
jgi:hypothetical protein